MENEEKKAFTFNELKAGDTIKHPTWGALRFKKLVKSTAYFVSKEGGDVAITNDGTKFRKI